MRRATFQSLVYYQFQIFCLSPKVRHGIFTRLGGQSKPPWDSLNTGHGVGDDPAAVDANHLSICRALGFESPNEIVSAHQVHGAAVGTVDARDKGTVLPATDALISQTSGMLLMLRFADCTPVMLYDPKKQVVALAHAGWRGTVLKTVRATVRTMIDTFSSRPSDIIAGIGPAIGPCCYEVGKEVADAANDAFPSVSNVLARQPNGRWHFDMWAANRYQLEEMGVRQIETAGICTACHTDEWFSHRAERGQTGRFAATIGL
ncbi:MAG: peptidoglycan editing factor PgeF [Anaerolineae bacterium]|nr:peptidoglycan editing factor PgeF [Anaerolineae bacterium]